MGEPPVMAGRLADNYYVRAHPARQRPLIANSTRDAEPFAAQGLRCAYPLLNMEIYVTEPGTHHQKALDRFLGEHPELAVELEKLNPLAARAVGQSIQEYRQEYLNEAFEAEAERLGFFAWELTLQLTTETAEEFEVKRLEVHREVAQMAGMEWAEYCDLYGLEYHI